jgi:flagellar basal-body rod protein FlgF
MANFVDMAAAVLSQAERGVEVSAQNLANAATPGYKSRVSFENLVGLQLDSAPEATSFDFSPGKPINTKDPNDLAILGQGFFTVRGDGGVLYTRQGQFERTADGRLVTSQGLALQVQGGGDLVLDNGPFQVTSDGAVIQDGKPVGKLAIADVTDARKPASTEGGMFSAPGGDVVQVDSVSIRQGAIEASNVSTGDQMITIMQALRRAEAGQRVVNVYDDLMGRALQVFGQA